MVTDQILVMLIAERDRLNRAIEALQGPKRRGRPPANPFGNGPGGVLPANGKSKKKTTTRKFTSEQRAAQAEKMKAYWAQKKKVSAKKG